MFINVIYDHNSEHVKLSTTISNQLNNYKKIKWPLKKILVSRLSMIVV